MARRTAIKIVDRDLGWRRISSLLADQAFTTVEVGARDDAKPRADGVTNAELAAWHEFGTGRVPARSFLRATYDREWPKYRKLGRVLWGQLVTGRVTKKAALTILGSKFQADIKARIRAHIPPPLADSTVDRKGSTTPLIDTGQLINSITYKVVRR